ncbi:MAG: RdgB/HAM1 family non-canonical purine NTP pyrophosphatase [Oscillospiraceae bacterium]|nr:RdgB/HAM1 family non-canonical purine NTP pyrophosphatase [Oscillospiraceae bacterium]
MTTVVLATGNAHKVEEFRRFFRDRELPVELISMREAGFSGEIVEDSDSFEGNAFLKASAVASATGMLCIADDSGLEVDALNGAPGIHSARYAGGHGDDEANIRRLLEELREVPEEKRTARFVCAICAVKPGKDGECLTVRGTAEGKILWEKRGAGTFGYDPVFLYEPLGKTFAELDGNTKNKVSHRGRALELLLQERNFFLK